MICALSAFVCFFFFFFFLSAQRGADVNEAQISGVTPLFVAAAHGQTVRPWCLLLPPPLHQCRVHVHITLCLNSHFPLLCARVYICVCLFFVLACLCMCACVCVCACLSVCVCVCLYLCLYVSASLTFSASLWSPARAKAASGTWRTRRCERFHDRQHALACRDHGGNSLPSPRPVWLLVRVAVHLPAGARMP